MKLDQVGGTKIVHTAFSADGKILSVAARRSVVAWFVADPKNPRSLIEDGSQESPSRFGAISGDGKRVYYADIENRTFRFWDRTSGNHSQSGFKLTQFTPLALATAPDADSALVVVLGLGGIELRTPTLMFVGLGDTWQLTEGLTATDATKSNAVGFSPDGKWLTLCSNGSVNVWKVPGSQKVSGKPREVFAGALAAAAGPNNLLAVADRPEGKKVRITLLDLSADPPKAGAAFATDIDDVSCLAFAPDGKTLAVADNVEGVVQLWALPTKK
jgi:WD40 repeat protein